MCNFYWTFVFQTQVVRTWGTSRRALYYPIPFVGSENGYRVTGWEKRGGVEVGYSVQYVRSTTVRSGIL